MLLLPRHWLAVEYIWVLVPYMTYDIYVMYLCHWHKSQEKGILEKKHSLASVWSFLLQERLMVTHHLFILIVLTPITQVRAAAGAPGRAGSWLLATCLQGPVLSAACLYSTSGESWGTSSWAASSQQS